MNELVSPDVWTKITTVCFCSGLATAILGLVAYQVHKDWAQTTSNIPRDYKRYQNTFSLEKGNLEILMTDAPEVKNATRGE